MSVALGISEDDIPLRFRPLWVCEECGHEANSLGAAFTHEDSTTSEHAMIRPEGFDPGAYFKWQNDFRESNQQ